MATARRLGKLVVGEARGVAGRVTEWWRQRKPFQTAGGESHQVYFEGDERSPLPMVASRDPRPVTYRLDEFDRKARDSAATDAQRAAASLISATRTALASNPDDPIIVTNLRTLFGLFDDPVRPVVARYQPRTGRISGDPTGTTVGTGMRIDGLNDDFIRSHPGSEPRSGAQAALMNLLVTDPSQRSPDKYIRGHLLNHRLGGIGDENNMFPITGNANSRHYHSTEARLVSWINASRANWAIYEVDVVGVSASLAQGRALEQNKVNATLQCRVVLKKPDGTEQENLVTAISSTYTTRHEAADSFRLS